jgi:2-phospho-L-lactate guanylyltransferase (CobY/MobA/RfbA family)
MSTLLIPVAPLSRTKSRLRDCFSLEQLKDLTIAMFKDLCTTLSEVNCFEHKIIYCNTPEILEIAEDFSLIGIKEAKIETSRSFDEVINNINRIALKKYNALQTTIAFLDLILITSNNFNEINSLVKENQLVVCPAIHSAGISILGRNPPDIIPSSFSDPNTPSLVALLNNAYTKGISKLMIYDSFRAGFDVDIKQDLALAYEYLKIFKLKDTEVFKFLENNLRFSLKKISANNNRTFNIIENKNT